MKANPQRQKTVEMEISGVFTKSGSPYPQVELKAKDGSAHLRIVIGQFEALAIFMVHNQKKPTRPISYDLTQSILDAVDARVVKAEITELHENTYFAEIHLRDETGKNTVLNSRPSDAIAVALRMGAPIYAAEGILEEATEVDSAPETTATQEESTQPALTVPAAMLPDTLPAVSPLPIENEPVDTVGIAAAPTDHVDELDLKRMLERAVAEEAYEEAARLRDVINQLP
jgi:bifunctional DNase/RNase